MVYFDAYCTQLFHLLLYSGANWCAYLCIKPGKCELSITHALIILRSSLISTLQAVTGWCSVTVAFRETYYYDISVMYYIVIYTIYFVYQIDH